MFAIRARRKVATERDFLDAVEKVVRQGTKFSSTYVFPFPNSETVVADTLHTVPSTRCITRFWTFCIIVASFYSSLYLHLSEPS